MKKRVEMDSRKILFIGLISLFVISVSVSLMSAVTNFTSPVFGGNYSTSLNITINVESNGADINMTNISCYYNGSGGVAVYNSTYLLAEMTNTSLSQVIFTSGNINISSIKINATYNISCKIYNGSTLNMTLGRVIRIDNTYPTNLFFEGGTQVDYANLSQNYIYFNVSNFVETYEKNITFRVYYSNGTLVLNTTSTNSSMRLINVTGLADEHYQYNVTVCDYSNNCNTTSTRNIALDNVNPSIGVCTCSPLTATSSGTITCTVNATDAISGIKTKSVTAPSMDYGTHTVTCTATDNAGRNATPLTSNEYTVHGGSGSSSGGGSSASTKTYIPSTTQLSTGYTNQLKSNERIKLTIASQTHYVSVTSLTTTSTTISVSSTPQTATLSIGEEKKFDVTGDGYYDLSVKLNSIKAGKADITVKSINEKIPAAPQQNATTTAQTPSTTETGELPAETPTDLTWLWILIIVVVILALIWIVYKKNKHKRR